jgi:hypothetical protein
MVTNRLTDKVKSIANKENSRELSYKQFHVFKNSHELEKNGLWDKAFIEHMDRTKIALGDLKSALKNQN